MVLDNHTGSARQGVQSTSTAYYRSTSIYVTNCVHEARYIFDILRHVVIFGHMLVTYVQKQVFRIYMNECTVFLRARTSYC